MKLIIAIVHDEDAHSLVKGFTAADFGVTKLTSTVDFKVRQHNFNYRNSKERVEHAIKIIERTCKTRKEITTTTSLMGDNSVMGMPLEISVGGTAVLVLM